MDINRIRQVAIAAPDIEASTAFFRDLLGAKLMASFNPPGLAFFEFSGVRLLLDVSAPKSLVYFGVDDIDAAYRELMDKGVAFKGEPHMIFKDDAGTFGAAGEGEWMAFFEDPAGNTLAIAGRK